MVVGGSDGFEPLLKVTVVDITGGTVRLGFEAQTNVPVHRLEVWERIRAGVRPESPADGAAAPVV